MFAEQFADDGIIQTQWTDDPSCTIDLCKGAWAGHRFDIVALKDVEGDSAWVDVSYRAAKFVRALKR